MNGTTATTAASRLDVMVHAVHAAFLRDMGRLTSVVRERAGDGGLTGPAVWACWHRFELFLRVHHAAEDAYLWPVVRTRRPDLAVLLERVEQERIGLVGMSDALEASLLATAVPGRARTQAKRFTQALAAHFRHEEAMLGEMGGLLTDREWTGYAWERHRLLGLNAYGWFVPWLLDEAPTEVKGAVLGQLPPPLRLLYRTVWRRRYLHGPRWQTDSTRQVARIDRTNHTTGEKL